MDFSIFFFEFFLFLILGLGLKEVLGWGSGVWVKIIYILGWDVLGFGVREQEILKRFGKKGKNEEEEVPIRLGRFPKSEIAISNHFQ